MSSLDTGTDTVHASVDDGVAVVTMNRPERRNALSPEMLEGLGRALALAETDTGVGAVVLTGAGAAFCSGGDVKAMAEGRVEMTLAAMEQRQRANQRATTGRLWSMRKPTIAALPGAAAGAGLGLALACDLRYAADTAVLTTAFARVGLAGDYGCAWLLTRLVGPSRARELMWFSEKLDAVEAQRLGLVNGVVPGGSLHAHVLERARRLADGPRVALAYMKENIDRAVHAPLEDYLDVEVSHHLATGMTDDHAAAAAAFVDKREPVFRGR